MQEKKRFHYGYLILFCCCMYMFVGMGVLHHALGQFLNPVTTDMGFSVGQFTFYLTFLGYTQVIVLLFARKLVERFDLRPVLMVASVVFVCGYVVVANAKSIYYWYVAGVMWGASAAFLAPLPVAILINRWFKKNNGAMIGFAMIFSSIASSPNILAFSAIIYCSAQVYTCPSTWNRHIHHWLRQVSLMWPSAAGVWPQKKRYL